MQIVYVQSKSGLQVTCSNKASISQPDATEWIIQKKGFWLNSVKLVFRFCMKWRHWHCSEKIRQKQNKETKSMSSTHFNEWPFQKRLQYAAVWIWHHHTSSLVRMIQYDKYTTDTLKLKSITMHTWTHQGCYSSYQKTYQKTISQILSRRPLTGWVYALSQTWYKVHCDSAEGPVERPALTC